MRRKLLRSKKTRAVTAMTTSTVEGAADLRELLRLASQFGVCLASVDSVRFGFARSIVFSRTRGLLSVRRSKQAEPMNR